MKKLTIYYIPDLEDDYEDTNYQQKGFATREGHVLADPKIYLPFSYGCHFKMRAKAPRNSQLIHEEDSFSVYESQKNKAQIITIVPNGIKIELRNDSLDTEAEQEAFYYNGGNYIEKWR